MRSLLVSPSPISGCITIPSSKSHTLRALIFAFLAHGTSRIKNPLDSPDTDAMIQAIEMLGAKVYKKQHDIFVEGVKGKPLPADDVIDVKNSGITFRFISAIAAMSSSKHILTGDWSIRHNRPVQALAHGLISLGAEVETMREGCFAPLIIKGPIHPGSCRIYGGDSQPVSALLIALSFLDGPSHVYVDSPGEKPWIDLTLDWLTKMGILYCRDGYKHFHLQGSACIQAFDYQVPADFSTAAFPLIASIVHKTPIKLEGLNPLDVQGDKKLLAILSGLGADISWDGQTLVCRPSSPLKGGCIDINDMIDALPILAVLGSFCQSPLELCNASIARKKESDRLHTITSELSKMGAKIEQKIDSLVIYPGKLKASDTLTSHCDHRIAMSLAVAASASSGPCQISDVECIEKTYRNFVEDFTQLGAKMELI